MKECDHDLNERKAARIHSNLLSPLTAGCMVATCLVSALLLVPRDRELVERLIEDGDHLRALQVVEEQDTNSALMLELAAKMTAAPAGVAGFALDGRDPAELLEEAMLKLVTNKGETEESVPLTQALAAIWAIDDISDATVIVATTDSGQLKDRERTEIYRAMGARAVADNRAALAVGIYATFRGTSSIASIEMLGEMIDAAGYAGESSAAIAMVNEYCAATGTPMAELEEPVRSKCVTLLRAGNSPSNALDLLIAELDAQSASPAGIQEGTLATAVETAGHAGRTNDMIPYLAAFVDALPECQLTWEESIAHAEAGTLVLSDGYRNYGMLLARYSEWTNAFVLAFDHYKRLAIGGDRDAFARAAELYDDLNRQHEFMLLLRQIVPIEGEEKYTRLLAPLLGDSGMYAESEKWYRLWLTDHQTDVSAWLELGALLEENANFEEALATFREASRLLAGSPIDQLLPVKKRIASLQIGLSDFLEPFQFYDGLEDDQHDAITLENYALLAEGLTEYGAYNRALFLRHKRLRKPKTSDYLELARSFAMLNDHENEIRVFKEGLARLPKSTLLHIELASGLRESGREAEAYELLAKPALRGSMQAMGMLIEVAAALERNEEGVRFLGRGIEKQFAFSPNIRLELGHIYEGAGLIADAEKLYSSVPDGPHTWPLLASARFKRGDYASAEKYQLRHLAELTVPDPEGWMFLGDIYRSLGREGDAENAYLRSLKLMESKLQVAQ